MKVTITTRSDAVTGRFHVFADNTGDELVPLRTVVAKLAQDLPRLLGGTNKKSPKDKQPPMKVDVELPNEYAAGSNNPLFHVKVVFDYDDKIPEKDERSVSEFVGQTIAGWFHANNWVFPVADFVYEIGKHGKYNRGAKDYKKW